MAVNSAQQRPNVNVSGQQSSQGYTQAPNQASASQDTWSFDMVGGLFGAPIPRSLGSEVLNKLNDALIEFYKKANANLEISTILLDKDNETNLAFSGIAVCVRNLSLQELGVAAHILIVEATGDDLRPAIISNAGYRAEIPRVTGDALDSDYLKIARAKISARYPSLPIRVVDGCVVPRNFDIENKNLILKLAFNAAFSCSNELEVNNPIFRELNLTKLNKVDGRNLFINIDFRTNRSDSRTQHLEDAVGNPIRSDVMVKFVYQKPSQQQGKINPINVGNPDINVCEIAGFTDLLWAPVVQGPMVNPYMMPNANYAATQKYAARFIICDVRSNFSYTLGSILLNIYSVMALRDFNNWAQSFRPSSTGRDLDIRDIGALNIRANITNDPSGFGKRVDTKTDSFKANDFSNYIATMIQEGLIVSMDVPECGPQSWYLSVFAAAANKSSVAYNLIYDAADQLTNGNFSRIFQKGSPIFVDSNDRVHLGYWETKDGVKRDIRDFDLLAVSNYFGENNPQLIGEWCDTWVESRGPIEGRLNFREKLIRSMSGESAVINGFAQRVTFVNSFLDSLVKASSDAGLDPRVNVPSEGMGFNRMTGVPSYISEALINTGHNYFNTGGGYGSPFTMPGYFNQRYF